MSSNASSLLTENPFHILSLGTRDDRGAIIEAAETAALTGDPQAAQESRATLTNPRKRLVAELAWLPGVAPAKARALIDGIAPGMELSDGVSGLARVNLDAHLLTLETPGEVGRCRLLLAELMDAFEQLSSETILRQINEDREIAGLPRAADDSMLETVLADMRRQWVHIAVQMVDRTKPAIFRAALYNLFDTAPQNELSDDFADALAFGMKAFLDEEIERAKTLCAKILELASPAPHALDPLLRKLDELLGNWEQTTRPLQVNAAVRGIEHEESRRVAFEVRETAVSLVNDFGLLGPAERLTKSIDQHFCVMAGIAERAEEDAEALARLTADFAQRQADNEAFVKRMRYSAEIGTLFKKRLTMDDKRIRFGDTTIDFADATGLSWGAVIHSTNGVTTGTEYSINLMAPGKAIHIPPRTQAVYGDLIDRLFATAGWTISLNIVRDVSAGGKVLVGHAAVTDDHVEFRSSAGWSKTEVVHLPWAESQVWSENGYFFIGRTDDEKVKVSLSYKDIYNVHILEHMLRSIFRSGGVRLSDYLKGGSA